MTQVEQVYTGIPLGDPANTCRVHWNTTGKTVPHWNATGETLTIAAYAGAPMEGLEQPTHSYAHIVDQNCIHASLEWQASSGQVSVNSALTWGLMLCSAYRCYSSNVWVLQHHFVHALDISAIIVFVYLGWQYKWNQLSSNNSCHTSCIHKGLHAGKWPDLMTPQTRRSQYPGIPVDRLHWNHTGYY